jgi:hypothetical protein
MKKIYISPSIEVIEIDERDSIMLAVSGETGSTGTGGDDDGLGEDLARKHYSYNNNNIWDNKW